jgi:hypothetical protein
MLAPSGRASPWCSCWREPNAPLLASAFNFHLLRAPASRPAPTPAPLPATTLQSEFGWSLARPSRPSDGEVLRIDGSTAAADRKRLIDAFNQRGARARVRGAAAALGACAGAPEGVGAVSFTMRAPQLWGRPHLAHAFPASPALIALVRMWLPLTASPGLSRAPLPPPRSSCCRQRPPRPASTSSAQRASFCSTCPGTRSTTRRRVRRLTAPRPGPAARSAAAGQGLGGRRMRRGRRPPAAFGRRAGLPACLPACLLRPPGFVPTADPRLPASLPPPHPRPTGCQPNMALRPGAPLLRIPPRAQGGAPPGPPGLSYGPRGATRDTSWGLAGRRLGAKGAPIGAAQTPA